MAKGPVYLCYATVSVKLLPSWLPRPWIRPTQTAFHVVHVEGLTGVCVNFYLLDLRFACKWDSNYFQYNIFPKFLVHIFLSVSTFRTHLTKNDIWSPTYETTCCLTSLAWWLKQSIFHIKNNNVLLSINLTTVKGLIM